MENFQREAMSEDHPSKAEKQQSDQPTLGHYVLAVVVWVVNHRSRKLES